MQNFKKVIEWPAYKICTLSSAKPIVLCNFQAEIALLSRVSQSLFLLHIFYISAGCSGLRLLKLSIADN